jgi:hypothetical protein
VPGKSFGLFSRRSGISITRTSFAERSADGVRRLDAAVPGDHCGSRGIEARPFEGGDEQRGAGALQQIPDQSYGRPDKIGSARQARSDEQVGERCAADHRGGDIATNLFIIPADVFLG